ncbi:cytochrome P450 [Paxillus ammoniavirescens]|nr:cytochrome P450 [Paxillus ammoniavirescens]
MASSAVVLFFLVPAVSVVLWLRHRHSGEADIHAKGFPLPPGPVPLPFLGSALSIDRVSPWLTYTAWAEKYGPLVHVRLLGKDVIVINSEEVARALLDERSSVYSDRPHFVTNEFFGLDFNSAFLPYGDKWRFHRKLFHQTFRSTAVQDMRPLLLRKAHCLAKAIVESPDHHAGSVIMAVVYGYETEPKDDRLVHVMQRLLTTTTRVMTPEREAIASVIPFIMHVPTWMPGSRFRREAHQCREYAKETLKVPFEYTVNAMASGNAPHSMVEDLLRSYAGQDNYDDVQEVIKAVATTAFAAAFGTTEGTVACFVLAMVLNPDVQRRAQAEIDTVVDMDRLPDFGDRPSLPYIDAVVREVMRWRPVTPLSLPHATSQSDVYQGYYIPKGAMVICNTWAMTRSSEYPDPDEFIPSRFLSESGTLKEDDVLFVFGSGRRMCPGRHLGETNVWSSIVTLLSCFEFSKIHDAWSEKDVEWENGVARFPHPFPLKVTPRARAKLISVE